MMPSVNYDSATGRISESDGFKWTYLLGTNLKSSLTYPNEAVVTWSYEPHRDLLTAVTNATYSTYVYTNDLLGRRTSKNDEPYGYNIRNELISANEVSYAYDDIGNRTTAEGKTYTANNLNQYTAIDDFAPQYDADGNQTLIKTETGIWSVVYNAENRPIRWQSGDTVITMAFDRMGRRVEMRTQSADSDLLQRFVYDNYLCIQQLRDADNALYHAYTWDPTEPIATRPLVFLPFSGVLSCYFHDGNKNVSDLVDTQGNTVHYAYTPFGTPTASACSENPFRFSSEFYDTTLSISYYNYRHYSDVYGCWMARDFLEEDTSQNLYNFVYNRPVYVNDIYGLWGRGKKSECCGGKTYTPKTHCCINDRIYSKSDTKETNVSYFCRRTRWYWATSLIVRPFSWGQFMLQHCWFKVTGNDGVTHRFGAYPSQNPSSSVREEIEPYPQTEDGIMTFETEIKLSICDYDANTFNKCVLKAKTKSWKWTLYNNCRDFVLAVISECKEESKRNKNEK